jgi:septal ring factor EnvC (AmiA/AmiB activator)
MDATFSVMSRQKIGGLHMSRRTPLAPVDRNAITQDATKPRTRQYSAPIGAPNPADFDSDIWNLEQQVGNLEDALRQTNDYNAKLEQELARLANVETDLARQRSFNAPLIDEYIQIHDAEMNRIDTGFSLHPV